MGTSSSVIQSMSHERLIEFAEENKLPQSIVDAIASSNTIDGEALAQAFFAFSKISQIKDEYKSIIVKPNLGFELDMHGQRLTWYLRWAIENRIPGYQQFMLKRSWCWKKTWNVLAKEGWSFDQVQKGILGCHFHGGFSSSIESNSVKNWLITSNEIPGSSSPLEKSETTGSVAYRIIKPATQPSKLTYRQAFIGEKDSKKSTHFVSHSWSYPFWSVLEALINHQLGYDRSWVFTSSMTDILETLDNLPSNKVNYYWFDLFNKNQHIVTSDSTSVELAEGIRQPGKMVFVLHPSMQWSVKRIWCLYEVLVCMQVEAELQVSFSFEMLDVFDRQQFNDGNRRKRIPWNSFFRYRALPAVDVENADATVESDKEMILSQIRSTIGVVEMNQMVKDKLMSCFEESTIKLQSGNCKPESDDDICENDEIDDFQVFCDDREFM